MRKGPLEISTEEKKILKEYNFQIFVPPPPNKNYPTPHPPSKNNYPHPPPTKPFLRKKNKRPANVSLRGLYVY